MRSSDRPLPLPRNLVEAAEQDGREAWLATVPITVARLAEQWSLTVGAPFQPGGQTAWLAPVGDAAGNEMVLKVGWMHPEALHEADGLRAWAGQRFSRDFDRTFAQTNRLRTEGIDALLAAAREAGVRLFVAQSFASPRYAREGGPVKTEDDPLHPTPVPAIREICAALRYLDQAVTGAGGIALRYGGFYGAPNDALIEPVRKRQFPIIGDGGGVSSFIHLDDAAAAAVLALEHDGAGIYNIVDDEPAPIREWLPVLAHVLGAKPPRRFPVWLVRLVAREAVVMMQTESRGASTRRPNASSDGRCATRAGEKASWPPTRQPSRWKDASLTEPLEPLTCELASRLFDTNEFN